MLQGVEQISSDELVADKVYRKDMGRYEEKKKGSIFCGLTCKCMHACLLDCNDGTVCQSMVHLNSCCIVAFSKS